MDILMWLRQLKRVPSQSCLHDRINFQFPWKPDNITQIHKTQATCFHHQMLQQIFSLFSTEDSHAAWGGLVLPQLLVCLHYQLHELESANVQNLTCPDLGVAVRKYFQGIMSYLQEKKHRPCAWEVVRREIEERLFLIDRELREEAASEES
ncbi:interferon alpha-13 [Tupaia chinensis]|nr:interferon alpha-13 [Tupaia chinensis]